MPPRGWSVPGDGAAPPAFDLAQLTALVESLRGVVPPDLARQLADALRELLLALRAVLDWYIARLEPAPEPPDRTCRTSRSSESSHLQRIQAAPAVGQDRPSR